MIHGTKNNNSQFINLVDSLFGNVLLDAPEMHYPLVNIKEQEKDYQLEIVAPGLLKEQFKLNVNGDQLIVSATAINSETETKFIKKNFVAKDFTRSFRLNKNLNIDAIHAQYENGILTVTIGKVNPQPIMAKEIAIN
jgi:HSP20 family protein